MKLMIQIPTTKKLVERFVVQMESQGYLAHNVNGHGYFTLDGKTILSASFTAIPKCYYIGMRPSD